MHIRVSGEVDSIGYRICVCVCTCTESYYKELVHIIMAAASPEIHRVNQQSGDLGELPRGVVLA